MDCGQHLYIAVERLNHYGKKVNKSAWAWKDEIASWTWDGYEGRPAIVNVYAAAEEIELFLNGKSMGRKNAGEEHEWMCSYEIPYEPGELKAVGYTQGNEAGQDILVTAGKPAILKARADRRVLKADGADLSYITVNLADEEGEAQPLGGEGNYSVCRRCGDASGLWKR